MYKLYEFPKQAEFGKPIAKTKIYEKGSVNTKLKEVFINEIEKIIWSYKLSPKTINIKAGKEVEEIQIFTLRLKKDSFSLSVLEAIDKAIPSPIIFRLIYNDKVKFAACYKRRNLQDKNKWQVSNYFSSNWSSLKVNIAQAVNLPTALNLDILYYNLLENIIKQVTDVKRREDELFSNFITRLSDISAKEKELVKIQLKLKNEKQFNRKVEINKSLNFLKQEIKKLGEHSL